MDNMHVTKLLDPGVCQQKDSLCNVKEELSKWGGAKRSPMKVYLQIPTFETQWQPPWRLAFLECACQISQIHVFSNCK
jgi:hypothetical protein